MWTREHRRAIARLAALAATLLAAGASRAAEPGPGADAPLAAILAAHCRAREATSTLRARFLQTKTFEVLGEEETSAGELFYRKPDSLRWQYAPPDGSWTVIRGREGWAVFPGVRQVHRFELGGSRVEGILSVVGFGACGPAFARSFEVAMEPPAGGRTVLTLTPLRAEIAASFAKIELTLDPGDHLPRRVVLHETTGDQVRLEFVELRRDVPIDRSLFEFTTPKSYSVVP
jgi:outer membrane lipoprotein carrier protein